MNQSMTIRNSLRIALCALCCGAFATAQIGPEDAVRKILDDVSKEMAEIDRLLLESSRGASAGDAAERMEKNAERMRELIGESRQSQEKVVRKIDALIDELQKMAQQSSSSSSQSSGSGSPQDSGQPQPGERPQDQQPGRRDGGSTPDYVEQGQPEGQPGQQQQEGQQNQPQPGGEQPDDPGADPLSGGRNTTGEQRADGGTERVLRDGDDAVWGQLPQYVRFLQRRGGLPEVPSKYRRLHEAWQKQNAKRNR